MKSKFDFKKLIGVYVLLLVLIPGVILLSGNNSRVGDLRSQAAPNTAVLTFWPAQANLKVNQTYDVEIRIDPSLKPSSLDLVVSFDPKVVSVSSQSPVPGNLYDTYQAQLSDNTKGLAGISGRGTLQNGTTFATLKVTTLAPGDPKISLNYANGGEVEVKVNLPQYVVQ